MGMLCFELRLPLPGTNEFHKHLIIKRSLMPQSCTTRNFLSVSIETPGAEQGRRRVSVKAQGRREILSASLIVAAQVNDSKTELLSKYLKKSEENKAKNDKERLESFYKRNYKDYFGLLEGTLRQKSKDQLTEAEKGIVEWLDNNK